MILDAEVPVEVQLGADLVPALPDEWTTTFRARLATQLGALQIELGISASSRVEVTLTPQSAVMELRVHGTPVVWDPKLAGGVALLSPDVALQAAFDSDGSDELPLAPLARFVGGLEPANLANSAATVGQFLVDLTVQIVRDQAGVLAGPAAPGPASLMTRVRRRLLDLGISLADVSWLSTALEKASGPDATVDELVERAFAAVPSDVVELQVNPTYLAMLRNRYGTTFVDVLVRAEQQFFERWGIEVSELAWSATPAIDEGLIGVRVNHLSGLPMRGPRLDPTPDDAELVHVIYEHLVGQRQRLVSMEDVEERLERLQPEAPGLVEVLIARFSIEEITRLFRGLLGEGIPILFVRGIAEALIEYDTVPVAPDEGIVYDDRLPVDPSRGTNADALAANYLAFARRKISALRS